jgi:RHS repeat-associated protein
MYPAGKLHTGTQLVLISLFGFGLALPVKADRVTRYTYNALGLVETVDGPRLDVNDITNYSYDAQGNRTLIRNALGHEIQISAHDAAGRPLTLVDPNGLTTQLSYNSRGHLIGMALSDGITTRTTAYTYDSVGNLTGVTQPDGTTLGFVYDAANQLIGLHDGLGNRIDYTLDAMGNRTSEQISDTHGVLLRNSHRIYDELGRLIQLIDARNQKTGYQYDGNGNLTQQTDARLNPTAHLYDALDRLKQTSDALYGVTDYTYDSQDNLTSVTDPNRLATTYTYDGLGNRLSQSSPDTGLTTYTYDAAGNRLSQTDARGITLTYSYDALNRLTGIRYPDPSLDVSYDYDQGVNGIGRLTRMSDAQGTTEYAYDAFGRLILETRTDATLTTVFRYIYDEAGRLTSLTYPSGHKLLYGYDDLSQLSDLTLESPDASLQPLASNIQYLPFGPLQSLDYGNGLSLNREFDQNYRLISQAIPGVLHSGFELDPVGNLTDWIDRLDAERNQRFDYDALDRLIHASGRYGELSFEYDPTGNRLRFTQGLETDRYHYASDSHRLLEILGTHPETRTYDATGNTLQSAMGSYVYDDTNRLVHFTRPGVEADYAYNGKGERVSKTVNGRTIHFRYSPEGQLLGEYDAGGKPLREYLYLQGQPLAQLSFSTVGVPNTHRQTASRCTPWRAKKRPKASSGRHKHKHRDKDTSDSDHRKPSPNPTHTPARHMRECCEASTEQNHDIAKRHKRRTEKARTGYPGKRKQRNGREAPPHNRCSTTSHQQRVSLAYLHTDHLGAVVKATDGDQHLVWDAVRRPFGSRNLVTDQIEMPLGFPGQYYDEESGVLYNYFRDYDPSTGRYLESDPIGLNGGLNTYTYVSGNPTNHIDPQGLVESWWHAVYPADFNTQPGYSHVPPSYNRRSAGGKEVCKGTWIQVGWSRVYNVVCQCVWLCLSCEYRTAWSGNTNSPYLPRTMGTVVFNPHKTGNNFNPDSGNDCICKNRPGPEKSCDGCD